jgi:hypothetical protein
MLRMVCVVCYVIAAKQLIDFLAVVIEVGERARGNVLDPSITGKQNTTVVDKKNYRNDLCTSS